MSRNERIAKPVDAINQISRASVATFPATRRTFLASLLAGAGSLALAACGGGGGGSSSGNSSSVTASSNTTGTSTTTSTGSTSSTNTSGAGNTSSTSSVAPTQTAQQSGTLAESASGTTMPSASAIVDSGLVTWTLASGRVLRAGVDTGLPMSATLVLYWSHTVYAEDASGNWYVNTNSVWSASSDPRVTGNSSPTTTPSTLFYGINGHMAYDSGVYQTTTAAQQLALLKDLGVTNYRADVASAQMAQVLAVALNGPFKNSGVAVLPCITTVYYDQTASEATAYAYGFQLASSIATVLKGLVTTIECGNEMDTNGLINGAGNSPADYNTAYWPAFRGAIRGMIDGVKSVDPTIKCGVNVGVPLAYTALRMLWNGETPNGTATATPGATPVRWDVTMYHWYESSGDIQRAGTTNINVLQILSQTIPVPIWLTEWGFVSSDSPADQAQYVTNTLNEYYSVRNQFNLQSVMFYDLIDTGGFDIFGLIDDDGVTKKPAYAAFKSFVAANPA